MLEVTEERVETIVQMYSDNSTDFLIGRLENLKSNCDSEGVKPAYCPDVAIEILGILKIFSRRKTIIDFGDGLVAWLTEFVRTRKGKIEDCGKPVSIW